MATKTKELTIECSEVRITPNRYNHVTVILDEPKITDLLAAINTDDLIEYVQANIGVDEIYSQSELDKWAESEGYTKEKDK